LASLSAFSFAAFSSEALFANSSAVFLSSMAFFAAASYNFLLFSAAFASAIYFSSLALTASCYFSS